MLDVFIACASLTILFCLGWAFLNRSLFKDYEEEHSGVQVRMRKLKMCSWLQNFVVLHQKVLSNVTNSIKTLMTL